MISPSPFQAHPGGTTLGLLAAPLAVENIPDLLVVPVGALAEIKLAEAMPHPVAMRVYRHRRVESDALQSLKAELEGAVGLV